MSFLKKVKEFGGDIADTTKRGAIRGKLELEVRRIEGRVDDEKHGIGQDLFPLLESGELSVELQAVKDRLARIVELQGELAAKRAEMDALKESDDDASGEDSEAKAAAAV